MISIGSDHGGIELKETVQKHLQQAGYTVEDCGTDSQQSCDYPDYAFAVAQSVTAQKATLGILVCGSGTGMSIAANKVPGIRAANCFCEIQAKLARSHNDANILCLGQRLLGDQLALAIVDAFLDVPFEQGRHAVRLQKIADMEGGK